MINDLDREFIGRIDQALQAGDTYQEIADREGLPLGTLYGRIRALGYRTAKRLEPIHAPALDSNGTEAAA